MADRVNARRQLADARERIIADMDRLQQKLANYGAQIEETEARHAAQLAAAAEVRAEEKGLRAALELLGPVLPQRNRKAAAPAATKPARKLKVATPAPEGVANPGGNGRADDAAARTIQAAAEAGLLPT